MSAAGSDGRARRHRALSRLCGGAGAGERLRLRWAAGGGAGAGRERLGRGEAGAGRAEAAAAGAEWGGGRREPKRRDSRGARAGGRRRRRRRKRLLRRRRVVWGRSRGGQGGRRGGKRKRRVCARPRALRAEPLLLCLVRPRPSPVLSCSPSASRKRGHLAGVQGGRIAGRVVCVAADALDEVCAGAHCERLVDQLRQLLKRNAEEGRDAGGRDR